MASMKTSLLLLALALGACSYRSFGTVIDDNTQEMAIGARLLANKRIDDNSHVNVTVYNGRVLLTGEARDPGIINEIVWVVSQQENLRNISNNIIVGPRSTLSERAYDSSQTAKVKTALMNIHLRGFNPTNIKVFTEQGITYLMGIVNQQQAQIVTETARRVSGVRSVVTLFDYFR